MRLRSSQFVFLLLLACSVNLGDDCVAHLLAGSVASPILGTSELREFSAPAPSQRKAATASNLRQVPATSLDPAARAAHRVVWSMRRPASHSAAIISYTGFLRA
jgi:hypothetical protein